MASRTNRRRFLQTGTAVGVGFWVAGGVQARASKSPNERIAMASIGVGGKGQSDSDDAGRFGDMVAICDTDGYTLGQTGERRFPKAKRYADFRKMLDELGKSIDAVTVSTADHTHAAAGLMAMRMGKHCFCQKPLTRTIYESRLMAKVAREMKVATQMGNQGTAGNDLRQAAAWIKAGALGAIKEIHVWTNRPIWNQGEPRPAPSTPPKHLDWDLWLGPAPVRPFGVYTPAGKRTAVEPAYHPFHWRGWWDFGTGALGDIACHVVNMPFMALDLRAPQWVQAETSGHDRDGFPAWSVITYEFAATANQPALKMVWYDGKKLPPAKLLDGREPSKDGGILTIGEKGKLLGYNQFLGMPKPEAVPFTKSPGHFEEWVNAIKGEGTPVSNFPDFAGPLSETVLIGNLAVWGAATRRDGKNSAFSGRLYWDAARMAVKDSTDFDSLIKPTYRKGFTLD